MKNRNMKKDLDVMLAGLTLSPERRDAILREANRKHHPFRFAKGKILLAAALVAALSVSAYAISPTMQETLQRLLGGLSERSQTITDVVSECDGIEVRPVSALADQNFLRIYCEVQDTTGDRLSEDMYISSHTGELWFGEWGVSSSPEVVSYDETTHNALLCIQETGLTLTEPTPCTISFERFTPCGREDEKHVHILNALPSEFPENLKTKPAASDGSYCGGMYLKNPDGYSVVLPEQNPFSLDKENTDEEYARISSVGFGDDGYFHLLTAFMGDANRESSSMHFTDIIDTRTGKDVSGKYSSFLLDGTWYYHVRYDFGPEDLPYVEFNELYGWYHFRDAVEGNWSVDVTIEPVEGEIIYKPNTMVYNVLLEEVHVTPISVIAIASDRLLPDKRHNFFHLLNAYATLRDGTRLDLSDNKILSTIDQWTFDEPINPADLVSITFGRDGTVVLQ